MDQHGRSLRLAVPGERQRSYEHIARAQTLIASSKARLDRSEARLRRADARDVREQKAVDQEVAASARQADGRRRSSRPGDASRPDQG
ncbi:hypothetical protein [Streptomyces sp. MNP-20]|uniref:hypothetical protein n=1 Tax=Streptomyces sp. MNP-20 TaxID=2721165 RepID=UPI00155774B6|nr:hypothetical protein [Streptomyces sp. MNP-20]